MKFDECGAIEIEKVADMFGVSPSTIRREIKEGKLKTITLRNRVNVTKRSIIEYQRALEAAVEKNPTFTNRYV